MHQLHHTIAASLLPLLPPQAVAELQETARYVRNLQDFDWQFEFSDCGVTYTRAKQALAVLHAQQAQVDPDGSIWLACMPADRHGCPRPAVKAQAVAVAS